MPMKARKITTTELRSKTIETLEERGITLHDIAEIVVTIQKRYSPDLTIDVAIHNILRVLQKREVCNAILTGLALDKLAEQNLLPSPIQEIIMSDEPLYGIDEVIPLSIINIYGTIGFTSFGYLDKEKIGIIKKLDEMEDTVHTFADDIVCAIAAAAASRVAHRSRDIEDNVEKGS
ncbi:phosphatidylglycerophosphatase A [Bacillus phage G]|uniref:Gp55 n=1 Tax=Bacillus phage G TaxID=2884420 RepID=G3MBC5_9CAUD|nr:phosphatidylglycerophosphatase A [Bacillus phage G]AEO93326.1 gp55 [Bacillus phage G]